MGSALTTKMITVDRSLVRTQSILVRSSMNKKWGKKTDYSYSRLRILTSNSMTHPSPTRTPNAPLAPPKAPLSHSVELETKHHLIWRAISRDIQKWSFFATFAKGQSSGFRKNELFIRRTGVSPCSSAIFWKFSKNTIEWLRRPKPLNSATTSFLCKS